MGGVLALQPSDLVDLLLNLQGLEVVELRLVGLIDRRGGSSSTVVFYIDLFSPLPSCSDHADPCWYLGTYEVGTVPT